MMSDVDLSNLDQDGVAALRRQVERSRAKVAEKRRRERTPALASSEHGAKGKAKRRKASKVARASRKRNR